MKSDVVLIDTLGNGFEDAVTQTRKTAAFTDLGGQDSTYLQLMTEEMLSLVRIVTGENQMSFWLECEDGEFRLHLSTKTIMDKEKRYLLISSSSSRKNDAARSLLGKLRDKFEEAMLADVDHSDDIPLDVQQDVFYHAQEDPEWDRYERSVLRKLADDIRISIRGRHVDMTVSKRFA